MKRRTFLGTLLGAMVAPQALIPAKPSTADDVPSRPNANGRSYSARVWSEMERTPQGRVLVHRSVYPLFVAPPPRFEVGSVKFGGNAASKQRAERWMSSMDYNIQP